MHLSETQLLLLHSGTLCAADATWFTKHLWGCESCRAVSEKILTALGSLSQPARSDVSNVECFVDRLIIDNDLALLDRETALRLTVQSRIRFNLVYSLLGDILRPGFNLRALTHSLIGRDRHHASTSIEGSGAATMDTHRRFQGQSLSCHHLPTGLVETHVRSHRFNHAAHLEGSVTADLVKRVVSIVETDGCLLHQGACCFVNLSASFVPDARNFEATVAADSVFALNNLKKRLASLSGPACNLQVRLAQQLPQPFEILSGWEHIYN